MVFDTSHAWYVLSGFFDCGVVLTSTLQSVLSCTEMQSIDTRWSMAFTMKPLATMTGRPSRSSPNGFVSFEKPPHACLLVIRRQFRLSLRSSSRFRTMFGINSDLFRQMFLLSSRAALSKPMRNWLNISRSPTPRHITCGRRVSLSCLLSAHPESLTQSFSP
jgi:hypothetical protein